MQLSQVKTGEEEEEVMYKQRARLYRYAKELGVWKERGVGDVKLLRHRNSGILRLLMRREQVRAIIATSFRIAWFTRLVCCWLLCLHLLFPI